MRQLVKILEEKLGKQAIIESRPTQPGDAPQTFADISKARALLNYNPQTKIEAGVEKFIEWFVEMNGKRKISDSGCDRR